MMVLTASPPPSLVRSVRMKAAFPPRAFGGPQEALRRHSAQCSAPGKHSMGGGCEGCLSRKEQMSSA